MTGSRDDGRTARTLKRQPSGDCELDPKLGWLQAFAATAFHLNYDKAADEVGVTTRTIISHVDGLQKWLNRGLFVGEDTLIPLQPFADEVAMDCIEAVELVSGCIGITYEHDDHSIFKSNSLSSVGIAQLRTIFILDGLKNYKKAANALDVEVQKIYEHVRHLRRVFDDEIICGKGKLTLTSLGKSLASAGRNIVKKFEGARTFVPGYDDPLLEHLSFLKAQYKRRRIESMLVVRVISRRNRLRKSDKNQLLMAVKSIVICNAMLKFIKEYEMCTDILGRREVAGYIAVVGKIFPPFNLDKKNVVDVAQ